MVAVLAVADALDHKLLDLLTSSWKENGHDDNSTSRWAIDRKATPKHGYRRHSPGGRPDLQRRPPGDARLAGLDTCLGRREISPRAPRVGIGRPWTYFRVQEKLTNPPGEQVASR
jgi:hypothetical protein